MSAQDSVLPAGSKVLVTGANGFIGAHIINELLKKGYKVRGTVRSLERTKWVTEHFNSQYGSDSVELVEVAEIDKPGAFDEAVKGVSAVAHTLSDMGTSPDASKIIPQLNAGVYEIMRSADRESTVKRFVYTSSSTAATSSKPGQKLTITEDTWNEEAKHNAWNLPLDAPGKSMIVYAASKTEAEQAVWRFVKEYKPKYEVNCVLPNANFGLPISVKNQGYPTTSGWSVKLFKDGNKTSLRPSQWFVDVRDTALLHVAALTFPTLVNQRIFGFAEPYDVNQILAILRKNFPDRKFVEDEPEERDVMDIVPSKKAAEILKQMGQSQGWRGIEESVVWNVSVVAKE